MIERFSNGKVALYSGCYPIVYVSTTTPATNNGACVFCPECADEMCQEEDEVTEDDFTGSVNWETPTSCDICSITIEAAYEE